MPIGIVENIEFTHGGLGNQFTTIDGKEYHTWWDALSTPVRVGAVVEYIAHENVKIWDHPLVYGDKASIIAVLNDVAQSAESER